MTVLIRQRGEYSMPFCDVDLPNAVLADNVLKSPVVRSAVTESQNAVIVSREEAPYEIVALNKRWSEQCGFGCEETIGRTPKELLQGEHTDQLKAKEFSERVESITPFSAGQNNCKQT